jgi:hypothetical protein
MLWSTEIQGEGRDGPVSVLRRSFFGQEKQSARLVGSVIKRDMVGSG